jgi:S1-C subfamily serine protease
MKPKLTVYVLLTAGVILSVVLMGCGFAAVPSLVLQAKSAPALLTPTPLSNPLSQSGVLEEEQLLMDLYRRVNPSVVNITTVRRMTRGYFPEIPGFPSFPDMPEEYYYQQGEGSGFVWDEQGYIVTNNHVVEGAETVAVTFWDNTTAEAKVIGTDPDSDLAVIRVNVDEVELQPVVLGDSDALRVGQLAIAIGNPFGQEGTMTRGIVSALGRTFRAGSSPFSIPEMIQTDAAINPGNSGGPLLNSEGQVIGINNLILSRSGSSSGVGFAIPINIARRVVPELIDKGRYRYAWLGISGTDINLTIAQAMDLPTDTRGAMIIEVVSDGPAAEAGLRGSDKTVEIDGHQLKVGGDIIVAIEGTPIRQMDDVVLYLLEETRPNQKVTLSILRDGKEQNVTVKLGERPRR